MKVEYVWSEYELRAKKCYGCISLKLHDNKMYGDCTCEDSKVENKMRSVTDRKCARKRLADK